MATTAQMVPVKAPVRASSTGAVDDEYLRALLHTILRRVTGGALGPLSRAVARRAADVQRDLDHNIANAYRWHYLLLALQNRWDAAGPGASSPLGLATQDAIRQCIRLINDHGDERPKVVRRSVRVQWAWNERMPAMVM